MVAAAAAAPVTSLGGVVSTSDSTVSAASGSDWSAGAAAAGAGAAGAAAGAAAVPPAVAAAWIVRSGDDIGVGSVWRSSTLSASSGFSVVSPSAPPRTSMMASARRAVTSWIERIASSFPGMM